MAELVARRWWRWWTWSCKKVVLVMMVMVIWQYGWESFGVDRYGPVRMGLPTLTDQSVSPPNLLLHVTSAIRVSYQTTNLAAERPVCHR